MHFYPTPGVGCCFLPPLVVQFTRFSYLLLLLFYSHLQDRAIELNRPIQRKKRRPRQTKAGPEPSTPAQARHQSQPNATSATQSEDTCRQVPRLPRKVTGHQVPRLPRETKLDVSKCHAGHIKRRRGQNRPLRPKRVTGASLMP